MGWMATSSIIHLDARGNTLLLIFHRCMVLIHPSGERKQLKTQALMTDPQSGPKSGTEKRKSPGSNHCGWNRVAVGKVDLFAGRKHGPDLLKKSRHRLANVARLLSDIFNNH